MVINKFSNREVYEKIKAKGSLGANDVNVLEDYPGPELTEADKSEIAGKVIADGTEFELSDFPTALKNPNALTFTGAATGTYDGSAPLTVNIPAGGSSGSGGALKAMSAVSGYIGIPAADLPENGVVWMCFGSGDSTELYTGTVTIQDAWIAVNDMLVITNGTVNPLNQVSLIRDGLAIYGLSTSNYRGVYQVVDAGGDSGESLSLGMTSAAAVGQIAKISAVDANGVPTAWEPVDMPSGGSSADMRVIKTITITDDGVNSIYFNRDDNGLPFALTKHIRIRMYGVSKNTGSTQAALFFRAGQTSGDKPQYEYPIKVNVPNANYIFDVVLDLYSAVNCWYGDYAHAREASNNLYRFVPSENNNLHDITVREIKLVWSNASVFFQQGATIVVEGM